jgi:D-alanyl-D-alanine carboxypeptidase/D-alanyl-D-alanine-endopeptidase (penicillin-binding protein 4)
VSRFAHAARGIVVAFAIGASAGAGAAPAALPAEVSHAFLAAHVPLSAMGIVVQEVGAKAPLFAHQPTRAFNPASTMKLVTTFAALELLGPDYRWKTNAYLDGTLTDGVLKGNLVIKGGGDPKITVEQWQTFMASLRAGGLAVVDGDLVLDRSFFAPIPHNPAAFDGEPLKPYNVGPDALLVNFKSVKFGFAPNAAGEETQLVVVPPLAAITVGAPPVLAAGACNDWRGTIGPVFVDRGSTAEVRFAGRYPAECGEREWYVSLLDSPSYVAGMFATYFTAAGGRFTGGWKEGRAPRAAAPFATLESAPLFDVVRDVNKLSNNVMARQVFLTLATARSPPPATTAGAARAVRALLAQHRLKMPELVLDNGSGLSRRERISAGSLVSLLLAADASALRDEYASSLAVAATDGTVQRRFQNGSVGGQALLKTGTLEGVRAIAGYVIDREGRRFALAALVNHPDAGRAQAALDFLVQWVYQYGAAWPAAPAR